MEASNQLMRFILEKWISQPIYAAAELGLADLLSPDGDHIDNLAKKSGTHGPTLYRMMRALASVGIFKETKEKWFELTPMGECLKADALGAMALMFHSHWSVKAWARFLESLRTGKCAFELAHNISLTQWLDHNPEAAMIFNKANAIKAARSHSVILTACDFSEHKTVVDIGGGVGALMLEILKSNPKVQGVVADTPQTVQEAKKQIESQNLENRCRAVECDFFETVPKGGDAYLLSNILHDWPDDRCEVILKNCYDIMNPGAMLMVIEMLIPERNEPSIAKLLDLEMLVMTGGRERTEGEYYQLLKKAGFKELKTVSPGGDLSIIQGIR